MWYRSVLPEITQQKLYIKGKLLLDNKTTNPIWKSLCVGEVGLSKLWWWNLPSFEFLWLSTLHKVPYFRFAHTCACAHVCIHTPSRHITPLHLHSSEKTPPSLSPQHPNSLASSQTTSTPVTPSSTKSLKRSTERLRPFKWGHGDQWSNRECHPAPSMPPLYLRKHDNRDKKAG